MKALRSALLLISLLCSVCLSFGGNAMYKVLSKETGFYKDWKGVDKICELHKGDTLYSNNATDEYIAEKDGTHFSRIPLTFDGKSGYANCSNLYPIKSSETDSLTFVSYASSSSRTVLEREFVPLLEWAMNNTKTPTSWLNVILVALVLAAIFAWVGNSFDKAKAFFHSLSAIFLVITSLAEVMYVLGFYNNVMWFIYPSMVGWGKAILDFLLIFIVIGAQIYLFFKIWGVSFNKYYDFEDVSIIPEDSTGQSWAMTLGIYPAILGLIIMILHIFDHSWSAIPYIIALGTLAVPAILELVLQLKQGHFAKGVLYAAFYIAGGIGITIGTVFLSVLSILILIVVGVLAIIVGAGSATGGSTKNVTITTKDGRKLKGKMTSDGTIYYMDDKKRHF